MDDFKLLRPEEVLAYWHALSDLLEPAISEGRGEIKVDDIRQQVLAGRMFLFASLEFAVTCEFISYPQRTVMIVGFGAGRLADRDGVADTLIAFAKSAGAEAIQTYCKNPAMVGYHRRWFQFEPVYAVLERTL